jgi:hypothetical protein
MFASAGRGFPEILRDLERFVADLEPEEFAPADVPALLGQVVRAEKLCAAARMFLARRAASLRSDERKGAVSSARWIAGQSGEGIGVMRRDLETTGRLSSQPELEQALRRGDLSPAQASVLLPALEADPTAAAELLEAAGRDQLKDLRERCQSVIAARRTEEEASAREARLRERRHLRFGTTFDGAVSIRGELAPVEGAVVRNALEALSQGIFAEARRDGRRESHDAYLADALTALCKSGQTPAVTPGAPRAEIVLHVSAEALRRGELQPGEFCEIAGVGPVSLSTVEYLFGNAFAKVIVERGTDVASVTHVGRWIPAHLDSALSSRDRVCAVPGCGVGYGLERDHIIPIEDGGKTELSNLVRLCHRHHYLKTHRYWRLLGRPGHWSWVQIRSQAIVPEHAANDVARPGEPTAGLARPLLPPIALDGAGPERDRRDATSGQVCAQQAFSCSWNGYSLVVRLSPALVDSIQTRPAPLPQPVTDVSGRPGERHRQLSTASRPAARRHANRRSSHRRPSAVRPRGHPSTHVVIGHLRTHAQHRPGGSERLGPNNRDTFIGKNGDVESLERTSLCQDHRHGALELLRSGIDQEEAVVQCRSPHRPSRWTRSLSIARSPDASLGAEPHGYPGPLHGPGKKPNSIGDEVCTTMLDLVAGHHVREQLGTFVQQLAPLDRVDHLAEAAQLPR